MMNAAVGFLIDWHGPGSWDTVGEPLARQKSNCAITGVPRPYIRFQLNLPGSMPTDLAS